MVAPTRSVTRVGDEGFQPALDTLDVAATFLDPATGRVVDEVEVGETTEFALWGSSVAVSPDRRMVAVTSAVATTVLDTRTRERFCAASPCHRPAATMPASTSRYGRRVGRAMAPGFCSARKGRWTT